MNELNNIKIEKYSPIEANAADKDTPPRPCPIFHSRIYPRHNVYTQIQSLLSYLY